MNFWRLLSIISIIIPSGAFYYCWYLYSTVSPGLKVINDNDFIKAALQINLDTSHSLANLTVGLAGGVWALVFSLNNLKVKGWELFSFVGGSVSLILSYTCYRLGLSKYVEMLYGAQTIDLSAPFVAYWPTWQASFFLYGFITLVVSFYAVYRRH